MALHEHKYCPRCKQAFECKVGDVGQCQCSGIQLGLDVQEFINSKYRDCLCSGCLQHLQNKYNFFIEKYNLK